MSLRRNSGPHCANLQRSSEESHYLVPGNEINITVSGKLQTHLKEQQFLNDVIPNSAKDKDQRSKHLVNDYLLFAVWKRFQNNKRLLSSLVVALFKFPHTVTNLHSQFSKGKWRIV